MATVTARRRKSTLSVREIKAALARRPKTPLSVRKMKDSLTIRKIMASRRKRKVEDQSIPAPRKTTFYDLPPEILYEVRGFCVSSRAER